MSCPMNLCQVDEQLVEKLKKFRFRKETTNAALIMKIDQEQHMVILDEEFEDISPEDLRNELPEYQPRFVVYSYRYKHNDGRISYPLCFIFFSPCGGGGLRKDFSVVFHVQFPNLFEYCDVIS
ncbi:glia maturation factor beta isoform X2 [Narcine bancroftii]|uniref:glia maturation factor beta isoform X2 n=1 Tax=Narcine bancroftii TaxID=1343680 RepID=UPI0038322DC9